MTDFSKKLESEETNIRYMVLVLLGAGINFTVGYALMLQSISSLIASPTQAVASMFSSYFGVLAVSYFLIGIIYSTSVSLAFQPKRIVSPIYVQVATAAFVPILVVFLFSTTPEASAIDYLIGSLLATLLLLLALAIFFVAGLGQTPIVRYLVGLNGTRENINSFGLVVNGELGDVLKVLKSDGFQEALRLDKKEERKTGEHSRVFRTSQGEKEQLFIAVIADPDDAKKTQLATASYIQASYGIIKTGDMIEEAREHIIQESLKKAGMKPSIDNTDSLARFMAYDHALHVTRSKLLALRSLPPHSKAIAIGLGLMTFLMAALWNYQIITLDMFETFLIFDAFAALSNLLPRLRTKRRTSD